MPDLEDEDLFVEADEPNEPAPEPVAPETDDEDDLEITITIDGEDAPAERGNDSDLVRKLRAEIRERDNRLKTYEAPKPVEVGTKPTLEAAGYDEEEFESQLLAWNSRKAKADDEAKAASKAKEETNRSWQAELQAFEVKKTALGAKDFNAAEESVVEAMNQVQQAVIIKAAKDPAKVIYALGRHPERLKALAAISDPIKLAVAIATLEGQITVNNRRAPPEPETRVRGSAPTSQSASDKTMERLEKEAEKTGDRTAVRNYRMKLAKAKK